MENYYELEEIEIKPFDTHYEVSPKRIGFLLAAAAVTYWVLS